MTRLWNHGLLYLVGNLETTRVNYHILEISPLSTRNTKLAVSPVWKTDLLKLTPGLLLSYQVHLDIKSGFDSLRSLYIPPEKTEANSWEA
jgi:hypothetical protein